MNVFAVEVISVNKSSPDDKLGIVYTLNDRGMVVDEIGAGSLLSTTSLRAGQCVTSINGEPVTGGWSRETVRNILGATTGEVHLEVWTPMAISRNQVPAFIEEISSSPVPLLKWQTIYHSIEKEMVPAVNQIERNEKFYKLFMQDYVHKQMGKGYIGFGLESKHEHKALNLVRRTSEVYSTAALVVTNGVSTANALLAKHDIAVKIRYSTSKKSSGSKYLPDAFHKIPEGIGFMKID